MKLTTREKELILNGLDLLNMQIVMVLKNTSTQKQIKKLVNKLNKEI